MSERFFVENPIGDAATAELREGEAHHLAKVMRIPVGAEILLFDGTGMEYTAQVSAISKAKISLDILTRQLVDRESPVDLTLAVALPKGDRQKFVLEKAVELGVRTFVPLETKRGVAEADAAVLERLRRQVIEASKQCERNRLMQIANPVSLAKLVEQTPVSTTRLLAHPRREAFQANSIQSEHPIVLAIGPEGGFTEEEVALAESAGWKILSLGPRILRVETAALALSAVLLNPPTR
jgi:16S rRNA (uracil1498-N3)-methyltransferase